jgi:iron(III) transport system ATP-binding protein
VQEGRTDAPKRQATGIGGCSVFGTSHASISARSTLREPHEPPESAFVAGFMGEAMLFGGNAEAAGRVRVVPLAEQARRPIRAGAVKVAVRPEAWQVGPLDDGMLPGTLAKLACLGGHQEPTIATELGEIFVVAPDFDRDWRVGERLGLTLAAHRVSVVAA